jgi:cytidylate kinase
MIFHIDGPSGIGKTTLGLKLQKINKNIEVIETDSIDDKTVLAMLKDPKHANVFNDKGMKKFFDIKEKINLKKVDKIIKNTKSHIIFIGLTITIPNPDYKYYIKADPDVLFKRRGIRIISDICRYKNDVIKTYSMKNQHKAYVLQVWKYKIRSNLPNIVRITREIDREAKEAKEKKYKITDVNTIYKEINKLIK